MRARSREDVAKIVGRNIRALREARDPKLSQERLARNANVSHQTIYRAERGVAVPDWDTLEAIAAALEVGLGDLLEGDSRVSISGKVPAIAA